MEKIQETPSGGRSPYRPDAVKALIASYPEGAVIKLAEFNRALNFPVDSTGSYTLLKRMMGRKEISRTGTIGAYTFKVTSPIGNYDREMQEAGIELEKEGYVNPAAVYAQRIRRAKEKEMLLEDNPDDMDPEEQMAYGYSFEELERLAMRFDFYNRQASVPKFLEWLKAQ